MKSRRRFWGTILIAITLYGCSSKNANNEPSSFVKYGISHAVKSVKVLSYKAVENFENINKGDLLDRGNYTMKFDNDGNCLEMVSSQLKENYPQKHYMNMHLIHKC